MDNEKLMTESEQMEMLRRIESKVNTIEKRQRRQMICRIILWVAVIAAIVALYLYLRPMILQIEGALDTVIEEVNRVDKMINSLDLDAIENSINELSKVNVKALIESTDKARAMIDKFSELNYEGLVDSINQLQEIIQPLIDLFAD